MNNKKGFTMVEMIIVIAIIAVLAMIVIPAISGYMEESDTNYNKKLVSQLEISGKNYYSENKNELPTKPYNRVALIEDSHVALPTLQSSNYVSKDFVDSEGRNCTESFVYVVQHSGSRENEYHSCLICDGINYSKEYYGDPYCEISNWNDKQKPNCTMEAQVFVDGNSKIVDGANGAKTFYNPTKITISDFGENEKIAYIFIRGYDNGTNNIIINKELDVSKMTTEEIANMNLMEYFPKKDGQIITAEYRITVMDQGGNQSTCLMNGDDETAPKIKVIIDKVAPTCAIKDYQEVANNKYIKFTEVKDNWSKQDNMSVLINKTQSATGEDMKNNYKYNTYTYSLTKATDGTYYGHVMDEAGNIGNCNKTVKIDMHPDEAPYCLFTKDAPTKWLKAGEVANLAVECYVDKSLSSNYDATKLEADNKLGTPKISKVVKNKGDNPDRTEYQIKYTATTAKKAGKDYVSVKSGFFKTTNNKVNEALKSKEIKIDTIPPTIKYSANKTKEDNKWYKTSETNPLVITATCTDSDSGVKEFIVNSSVINGTSKKITFKKANNPYTITSKCTDNAGNTPTSSTLKVYTKVFSRDKACGVELYKKCEHKDCGCKAYKSCRTVACGCDTSARCKAAGCADYTKWKLYQSRDLYSNCGVIGTNNSPKCRACSSYTNEYTKQVCGDCRLTRCHTDASGSQGRHRIVRTAKIYKRSCNYYRQSLAKCGCATPTKCVNKACGCKTYKTCRTKGCGVEKYKECWHY